MIKRVLTLDNALNITSRVLINDDAGKCRLHNRTVEDACPSRTGPPMRI
jgi:hypothetical protein